MVEFVQVFNIADMARVDVRSPHTCINAGVMLPVIKTGQKHIAAAHQNAQQNNQKNNVILGEKLLGMQIEAKAPIAEKKQGKQKHLGNMLGIEKGSSLQNCHKQTGKKNGSQDSPAQLFVLHGKNPFFC